MKKKKQKKNNGFDNNWDKTYKKKFHLSVWPWSDLISYSARYLKPKNKFKKILELGCGAGANIPFFLQRKFDYYGIEGSKTIIKKYAVSAVLMINIFLNLLLPHVLLQLI